LFVVQLLFSVFHDNSTDNDNVRPHEKRIIPSSFFLAEKTSSVISKT